MGDQSKEKDIAEIERYLLGFVKPVSFVGSGSYEIQLELSYQKLCHALAQHSPGRDIKTMTVIEVYTLMELIKEKEKKNGRRKPN